MKQTKHIKLILIVALILLCVFLLVACNGIERTGGTYGKKPGSSTKPNNKPSTGEEDPDDDSDVEEWSGNVWDYVSLTEFNAYLNFLTTNDPGEARVSQLILNKAEEVSTGSHLVALIGCGREEDVMSAMFGVGQSDLSSYNQITVCYYSSPEAAKEHAEKYECGADEYVVSEGNKMIAGYGDKNFFKDVVLAAATKPSQLPEAQANHISKIINEVENSTAKSGGWYTYFMDGVQFLNAGFTNEHSNCLQSMGYYEFSQSLTDRYPQYREAVEHYINTVTQVYREVKSNIGIEYTDDSYIDYESEKDTCYYFYKYKPGFRFEELRSDYGSELTGEVALGQYYYDDEEGEKNIVVPTTSYDGKPVTQIGFRALESIPDPEKIIYEGDLADWLAIDFYSAETAELFRDHLYIDGQKVDFSGKFVIPEGTTKLGNYAFYGCDEITEITIPASMQYIGYLIFDENTRLEKVNYTGTKGSWITIDFRNIYHNPQNIGDVAEFLRDKLYIDGQKAEFKGAYEIPSGVTKIGMYALSGLEELTEITIPNSVVSIGEGAFTDCTGLTSVNYIGEIKDWLKIKFDGMPLQNGNVKFYLNGQELTEIKESDLDGVTEIPAYAFSNISSLSVLKISDSITTLGELAFYGCTGLIEVTIPANVTKFGKSTFSDCTGLKLLNVADENVVYQSQDGVVYLKEDKSIYFVPLAIEGNVTILDGCENIAWSSDYLSDEYTFRDRKCLTSIIISDSVVFIGSDAFSGCTSLTEVTIGKNVAKIDQTAFSGCTQLQAINWNAIDCYVDYYAFIFDNCNNLTTVVFGDSVEHTRRGFNSLKSLQTVVIKAGQIDDEAFSNCTGLQTVTIGDDVTSIGENAFDACIGLQSVTIGAITYIGFEAFHGCTGLQTVTINAQRIGMDAFYGCTGLKTVTIGKDVISIESGAFSGCGSLTSVIFENPNGWSMGDVELTSGSESIDPSELGDPSSAVNVVERYGHFYWYRKEN